MALYQVNAGDMGLAEDINQLVKALTAVDAVPLSLKSGSTLLLPATDALQWSGGGVQFKSLSGSMVISATSGTATNVSVAHGLGRLPRFLLGFMSKTNLAGADAGDFTIHTDRTPVNGLMYWGASAAPDQWADATNVYVYGKSSGTAGTWFYRIFVL